jgi:cell shape-determining protein MreC
LTTSTDPAAGPLEAELLATRQVLAAREEALGQLNRRLLRLEKGEVEASAARTHELLTENQRLREELNSVLVERESLRAEALLLRGADEELARVHGTKLWRWSRLARRAYSRLRG